MPPLPADLAADLDRLGPAELVAVLARCAARLAGVVGSGAAPGGAGERRAPRAPRDVLSYAAAVARLPMRAADARRWLARHDLVRDLDGRKVVVWPDALDALRGVNDAPPARDEWQPVVYRGRRV